jgi:hypothetical protein
MTSTAASLATEFQFSLPRGLVHNGITHRTGKMRLANARDELVAKNNPHVRAYPDYLTLALLSQVITELGSLESVSAEDLENLFTQDLAYLREFYNRINQAGTTEFPVQCPACQHQFKAELVLAGEL